MIKDKGADKMADIAKSIGMDEKCQKSSRTYSDQSMFDTDTMAGAITIFGGGMASNSTTDTKNINEDAMMESGCGTFAVAASTILNETANISCTLNSSLTGTTTEVNAGARITVRTIRPSIAAIKDINATIAKMNSDLTKVSTTYPPVHLMDPAIAKNALTAHQNIQKTQAETLQKFIEENPSSADMNDTKVTASLKNTVKLKSSQTITTNHKAKMEDSIKSIAAAAAEQKMSQDLGFRAGSANSKQIVQQKVDNIFKSEKKNIEEKISTSFTKAVSSNEILVEVQGAINGSELNLDMMVQTNVQTSQAVKSGISIGHRVAAELGAEILTTTDTSSKSAGFDDLVREANEGLAKQIKAKGESDAATMGAMGDAMGGMFSGMFLMMLLPLLLILGVLFFAPKLVSGFIPPPLKIPLMIGIVVFIVFIVFGAVYSSTSENRTWPVSTEFMSVSGDRADTLGYMITNTKGRINKKPYEDFNFTAGGTWQI
tara:strand:+ start:241 stop:1701 length:1461 start_codon:yes stop_codon:yes gene_type:complete